ncbi:PREDICTED: glutathione S-transferase T3-like [Camelina sativa]|uniref:Glutathione S-transferase T3-like n=1 Tax=Camelina sativa TaxID=90675 RepID=A0ABM0VXZ2_CAMSA|nr:PREDICTED: glutathione S-transferase T3-like [Camelina sativa]
MDSPDSMNPDNSCFMDLLHSQMGTQNVVAHPYDSSSQVPIFSTQCPNDAPSEVGSTQVGRRTKTTWSPADDVLLISAWLNTSKDPITSNQQKGGTFWSRIEKYFASSPKAAGRPHREAMHCKQRWGKINDIVSKFVGCYEAAEKQRSSGMNEDDVMKIALQIYFDDHKVKFTLEHAWRELRHDQKWCSSSSTRGTATTKRRKCVDGSAQSSSSQPHEEDESTTRPPGIKASKGKSKRNVNNT